MGNLGLLNWQVWAAPVATVLGVTITGLVSVFTVLKKIRRDHQYDEEAKRKSALLDAYQHWARSASHLFLHVQEYAQFLHKHTGVNTDALATIAQQIRHCYADVQAHKLRVLLLEHDQQRAQEVRSLSHSIDPKLIWADPSSIRNQWSTTAVESWAERLQSMCESVCSPAL